MHTHVHEVQSLENKMQGEVKDIKINTVIYSFNRHGKSQFKGLEVLMTLPKGEKTNIHF